MRRLIAAALTLSLCFSALTACNDNEEEISAAAEMQAEIINEFQQISQIPRESGHERAISSYLKSWAKENGLESVRDNANNVIITKPASAGYENEPATILQCNMDTKIAVSDEVEFDPLKDAPALIADENTLKADGTSLGADSGIGMATALYVMKNAQKHGPLKAVFTADGESGMTGAERLKEKYLEGNYLVNLGWESGKTICLGSGGTAAYEMRHEIEWVPPQNALPYLLSVSGLSGGDAGKEIGKGGANAIKVIGEVLATAQGKGILFELGSFNGGNSEGTIPTAAAALIIINESDQKKMQNLVEDFKRGFESTYGGVEKDYTFLYEETPMPDKVVSFEDTGSIISFIYGILNGVQSMSEAYAGVVESATNLGMATTATGDFLARVSAASTSDVGLYKITTAHEAISSMSGLQYKYYDGIPRWPDHPDSVLFAGIQNTYAALYGDVLQGGIIHEESECGWLAKKNPRLQIVSIGPQIQNAGQYDEVLILDSVARPANVVMKFLEQTKSSNQGSDDDPSGEKG